jgi:hypothetical protein
MPPENNPLQLSRRAFFTSTASGLGTAALNSLLARDTVGAATTQGPLSIRQPHHPARAKHCIFIFLAGGISQVDLFDPKPKLRQLAGQQLPQSFFEGQRFSNIKREEALVMPGRFPFQHNGASGMELATVLPHLGACADDLTLVRSMHTDEFDHAPAEIFFNTGVNTPGRPSAGAWVCYGLGSESANLPGYVVLMTGRAPVSRTSAWGSSFLPSATAGVMFRDQGEAVLNLNNPAGITGPQQQAQLRAIRALNQHRFQYLRDPAIRNRIDAYEMAFRMQFAAPELNDLSTENKATHAAYGTGRPGESGSFSRNCLLARRLTERGVRFVSIFHRRWDHHAGLHKKTEAGCEIIDLPVATLIGDLKQRGLLEDTLVVLASEFGRTPVTENSGIDLSAGRDHHRYGFSILMAGGGTRPGHIVGDTDELGWHAVNDPIHVNDFHATLLHLMGLDHHRLTFRSKGLDVRLTNLGGHVAKQVLA